jgi:hypothetical protein
MTQDGIAIIDNFLLPKAADQVVQYAPIVIALQGIGQRLRALGGRRIAVQVTEQERQRQADRLPYALFVDPQLIADVVERATRQSTEKHLKKRINYASCGYLKRLYRSHLCS